MRRPPGLVKAEAGKGGVIGGEFDTRLQLQRRLAAVERETFDRLHQPPANASPLAVRGDGELADIKTVSPFLGKDAADDPVVIESHETGLAQGIVAQCI